MRVLLTGLNGSRERFGLASVDSFTHAYGLLTAGLLPEGWYPGELRTPGHRYYRAPDEQPLDPDGEAVPSDAPSMLAAFGSNLRTLLSADSKLLEITVDALGSLPVHAVVALGSDDAVASWTGPRPANVHLASFVPQRRLLGSCDLFLTHAGFSGVRESLSAGVPMVALPLFSDQPENAARIDELGLGVRVETAGLTPDALAGVVRQVLDDPAYRLAARSLQLTDFAADLVALA